MKYIYLFSLFIFTLCSAFGMIILTSYLPYSPIGISNSTKQHLQTFLPQGWAFFTRSPKEATINIYQIVDDGFVDINYKSGDPRFYFGANKSSRMQMVELGSILNELPDSIWIKNRGHLINTKKSDTVDFFKVKHKSGFRSITGRIALEKIEPIPWAWSSGNSVVKMPSAFVYLDIK